MLFKFKFVLQIATNIVVQQRIILNALLPFSIIQDTFHGVFKENKTEDQQNHLRNKEISLVMKKGIHAVFFFTTSKALPIEKHDYILCLQN